MFTGAVAWALDAHAVGPIVDLSLESQKDHGRLECSVQQLAMIKWSSLSLSLFLSLSLSLAGSLCV